MPRSIAPRQEVGTIRLPRSSFLANVWNVVIYKAPGQPPAIFSTATSSTKMQNAKDAAARAAYQHLVAANPNVDLVNV